MFKYSLIVLLLFTSSAFAEALCKTSSTSTPYCKYKGKISQLYINQQGLALAFIESPIDPEEAKKFGYNINSGQAFAVQLSLGNERIKDKFYQTLLSAFNQQHTVELHARRVASGYLEIDRIWLKETSLF